ncbi:hypothetical protein BT96DRAFT_684574 [Gymnopus androsaceus JB14]|uniref:Uncharacterized protein n=1 Tax=Gymnopus androsaceus JB14 TaxID=1447944 RepID=A0A6A4HMB5_9AGAR|nr:hypothetical protein BT96DRAFT_684574 [Gymnopus androsaceus JB14]
MKAQIGASVFGLLLTSCDSFLTRRNELEYIWNFRRPTFVRSLFISARYLALSIHIANIVLTSIWTARFRGHQRPAEDVCMTWQIFQAASCYTMLLILQLILSIRVFALYEQSLKVGAFLSMVLTGKMAGSIYITWNGLMDQQFTFTENCILNYAVADHPIGNPVVLFMIGEIVVHLVIHGLAWKRTYWDLRRNTFEQPPLVSVLNRDNLKVFAAISVAMISIGVAAGRNAVPVMFIYPVFISLVSTAGCRAILNLQNLDMTTGEGPLSEQNKEEFTTINDIWDIKSRLEVQ